MQTPRTRGDPIVSYGKHFGRTISAVTDVNVLLTNGLDRMSAEGLSPETLDVK